MLDRRDNTRARARWRAGVVGVAATFAIVVVGFTRPVSPASAGVRLAPSSRVDQRADSNRVQRGDERASDAAGGTATNVADSAANVSAANVSAAPAPTTVTAIDIASVPRCRAAVLVHGGGYFMGDHNSMNVDFADPLRAAGFTVYAVDYPLLAEYPQIKIDPAHAWYPRIDLVHVPAPMRFVHDRAVDAVAPTVADALATGCSVTLVGVSAGGAIVADLANRFPTVTEGVLVSSAALSTDHASGAPITIFYGSDDDVITADASEATCAAWTAHGSSCRAILFAGEGHGTPAVVHAALEHVLALN